MSEKRIKFDLPLPSISLKKFIERVLADDEFFSLALENPVGAMKECGVNLDTAKLIPSDLATFFGALDGLKVILKEKKIEKMTFENIFGQPAQIRGAVLDQQIAKGFFREWDNRDAVTDKMICYSIDQKFEVLRDRIGTSIKNMLRETVTKVQTAIDGDAVSATFEHAYTDNFHTTEWSPAENQRKMYRHVGTTVHFETDGIGIDRLYGPLINPVDLAAISARINAFSNVMKNT